METSFLGAVSRIFRYKIGNVRRNIKVFLPFPHSPAHIFICAASYSKKHKKGDVPLVLECPKIMPPKLPFTYAQLIHRVIKAISGKATPQEICNWIMTTYNYSKYVNSA